MKESYFSSSLMTCICCCKDKDKYLEQLADKFGIDVVLTYKDGKNRPFSYFDRSSESLNFCKRQREFYQQLEEDKKNFCKNKNCYSESQSN